MDFSLTMEQNLIRNSVSDLFKNECPADRVRELKCDEKGYDPNLWKMMTDLGFIGMYIPEEYGGFEGSFIDLMILMEEIGRYLVPSPFFSTVVLCSIPLSKFGNSTQKKRFLPGIAENNQIWSFALIEEDVSYKPSGINLQANAKNDHFILNGKKLFVPYANVTDWFLVFGRTNHSGGDEEGITAFIVDAKTPGISIEIIPTIARDMKCEVKFNEVAVPKENILGSFDRGWEIVEFLMDKASVLKSAEMSGGTQAVFEKTLNFVKERVQFGKSLGSFQVIQHRLVDMSIEVDCLKYIVYEAAWKIDNDMPCRQLCSMAKAKANEVYHRVCLDGAYLHGASGFTEEYDVGLYYIRSKAHESDFGGTPFHRDRIAEELEKQEPNFLNL